MNPITWRTADGRFTIRKARRGPLFVLHDNGEHVANGTLDDCKTFAGFRLAASRGERSTRPALATSAMLRR
jgi:hypothetical protein